MDTKGLNQNVTDITNLGFDKVWQGPSYETQSEELNELMTTLNDVIKQLDKFNGTLEKRDKYIEICKAISNLVGLRSEYDPDKPDEKPQYNSYTTVINALERDRVALRSEIISELSEYVGIDAEISPMMDLQTPEIIYLFDYEKLADIYATPGALKPTPKEFGLFDMYNEYDENGNVIPYSGEKYVNEQIAWVVSHCRNKREIAVNVSLLFAKLAADKGYALTYENSGAQGGPGGWVNAIDGTSQYTYHPKDIHGYDPNIVYDKKYNNITQVQEGMDCCAWVSYILNVATADDPTIPNPTGFAWRGVGGLDRFGTQVSPSDVKPGDIFIAPSPGNSKGHTGTIISIEEDLNNPGKGTITVAESGGRYSHYSINEYTYTTNPDGSINMLRGGTVLRNMDSVYNGEEVSKR